MAEKLQIMLIQPEIILKYDKPGPRYTSYPPANFFQGGFSEEEYIRQLNESNHQEPKNVSFYFHVPFCPQLCHFCGCNTELTHSKPFNVRYFEAMKAEFKEVAKHIDKSRPVTQIHWGGGTPNAVSLDLIAQVMNLVREHFTFAEGADIAMECNPAHLTLKQMDELAEMGFNRISIGIQDFNLKVLEIINRRPSKLPVKEVVDYLKSKNIHVNLDFVYGLPGQTTESFGATIREAVEIAPHRIVTFSYAHVPWVKSAMKKLEEHGLPDANSKLAMFDSAYQIMIEGGYVPIGLDHFAKPEDDMAQALNDRTLHRNFMGYCTQSVTGQVYAFGSTSITQLDGAYIQNIKDTVRYVETIESRSLAPEKGYILTETDKTCRLVIETLMCNHYLDLSAIAAQLEMSTDHLKDMILFDPSSLTPFMDDQLIKWENEQLTVLPEGRFFLRNIAMVFDPLLKNVVIPAMRYSKTV